MTTCTDLGATAGLAEVFFCAFDLATGARILTGLIVFIILIYALWKLRVPFLASLPLGIGVLFVFSGAGDLAARVAPVFTSLMWVVVMVFGIVMVLVFWRLKK